jgi:hypothetical protein
MVDQLRDCTTPNLKIDPALKEAAERAARATNGSVTWLIENLLIDHLRRTGHLPRNRHSDEGIRANELTSENDG